MEEKWDNRENRKGRGHGLTCHYEKPNHDICHFCQMRHLYVETFHLVEPVKYDIINESNLVIWQHVVPLSRNICRTVMLNLDILGVCIFDK